MAATYNAEEVAKLAGVSTWSIYNAVKTDESPFPFVRIGKRVVFPRVPCDRILGIESSLDEGAET